MSNHNMNMRSNGISQNRVKIWLSQTSHMLKSRRYQAEHIRLDLIFAFIGIATLVAALSGDHRILPVLPYISVLTTGWFAYQAWRHRGVFRQTAQRVGVGVVALIIVTVAMFAGVNAMIAWGAITGLTGWQSLRFPVD